MPVIAFYMKLLPSYYNGYTMPRPQRRRLLIVGLTALGAICVGAPVAPAVAATATTTFTVTATVVATCLISATNLAFGNYIGAVTSATSTITTTCTNTTPYQIGLNPGTFAGATVTTRRMTGADALGLAYGLFQDAAHVTNWGNTPATEPPSLNGTGSPVNVTVFGQVPAGQFVKPGAYTDTITATVTF